MAGGLNRREAIRMAMGMGDRVAREREQQSAIDVARGYPPSPDTEEVSAPPAASRLARMGARLKALRPAFLRRSIKPEG